MTLSEILKQIKPYVLGWLAARKTSGTPAWALDSAPHGSTFQIVDNGTYNLYGTTNAFAGLVSIIDETSGNQGLFINGGGTGITLVAQTGTKFSITAGTAGRINVYVVGGSYYIQIENKTGATVTLSATLLRFKAYA